MRSPFHLVTFVLVITGVADSKGPGKKICVPNPFSFTKFDGIAFDAYGTLLDVTSVPTARASKCNLPSGFVKLWREKQLNYSWLRTAMYRYVDFWEVTKDALDYALDFYNSTLSVENRKYLLRSWDHLEPFPDVQHGLDLLKASNQNLYILSNGTPRMLSRVLKNAGLSSYFQDVISVDRVKAFKPNPKVYASLEEVTCIERRKILFVSSNSWDGAGAKSYGFPTAWLNRESGQADMLGFPSDYSFATLPQIANFLQR